MSVTEIPAETEHVWIRTFATARNRSWARRRLTKLLQRTATRNTMHRNVLQFIARAAAAEQQALCGVGPSRHGSRLRCG